MVGFHEIVLDFQWKNLFFVSFIIKINQNLLMISVLIWEGLQEQDEEGEYIITLSWRIGYQLIHF